MNYKALALGTVLTLTGCGNWDKAFDGTIGNEYIESHITAVAASRNVSVHKQSGIKVTYFDRSNDGTLDSIAIKNERNEYVEDDIGGRHYTLLPKTEMGVSIIDKGLQDEYMKYKNKYNKLKQLIAADHLDMCIIKI